MADILKVDTEGLVKDFDKFLNNLRPRIRRKNVHFAALLTTRVKVKASGRPGPNAPTGDYRSKIDAAMINSPDALGFAVGTDDIRGRRLEMGFNGTDSLGRFYNQPPYPHFGPAVDEIADKYVQGVADALGDAS